MSTDIAIRHEPQQTVALSNEQLKFISNTEFVPRGLRGNVPAIMACVATGRALGIDDMSSLRLIHVVNGRPTFSAELMVQLVRRAGHSITGEVDQEKAVVVGRRKDNGDEMRVTWTIAMAAKAGLAEKATWQAYPSALLWARAVSQLCRMLFADVFAGGTYTPEELTDGEIVTSFADDLPELVELDEPSPVDTFGEAWNQTSGEEPSGERAPAAGAEASQVGDPAQAASSASSPVISEAQLKRLHTLASKHGVPRDEAKRIVGEVAGVESSKDIPRDRYDAVIACLQAYEPVSQFQAPAGAA